MGGGSIDTQKIDPRHPNQEKKTIGNWYQFQQDQLNKYIQDNPLLSQATQGAQGFFGQLPQLTGPLQDLLKAAPGFYGGLQGQLGQLFGQGQDVYGNLGNIAQGIGALQGQGQGVFSNLGNISNRLGNISGRLGDISSNFGGLIQRERALGDPLRNALSNQINPVLQSGGRLTPQLSRDVAQQSRLLESQMGTAHSTGALGRELLNRDAYREARFKDYLGMGNATTGTLSNLLGQEGAFRGQQAGIAGQQANIAGQQAGIAGQQGGILGLLGNLYGQEAGVRGQQGGILGLLSGITGQQGGLFGQQAGVTQGLAGGIQNLQTGGLNQLLGAQGANVSTFTGLQNPILGYLGNLFGQNLQSRIAQSQIDAQAQAANQSAGAGKAGGALSAGGSIISSVLPLLMFSDERLKRKIRDTGMTSKEGVPLKRFEYKSRPGVTFLGVLSKDVKAKVPSAVTRDEASGLELVDRQRFPIFELSATGKAA